MTLSDDPRIRFEVATPNGRDDVQIDMPDGSMRVLSYEEIGVTKKDIQETGISGLLRPMIEEAQVDLHEAAAEIEKLTEEKAQIHQDYARERQELSATLAHLEDKISKAQYILDDVVSVSVWPDYIPKDPDLANDPAAARVHNEHMFEGWNQDEIDGIQEVIKSLQRFYEQKQMLQQKLSYLFRNEELYDLHSTGKGLSFNEARDELERRYHEAQRRVDWLKDIAVQDTTFRSQEIIKKVKVAVPELEKPKSKARQLADSINKQQDVLHMLAADYRKRTDEYEAHMQEIGRLQDQIYEIESFLEAVTPENLWRDLGQLANPNAASNPYEARKWLDELEAEPDKGKEILTASAQLAKLYEMQNAIYAVVLQTQDARDDAEDLIEDADADLKASEEDAFIADQQLSARERYFRNRDSWDTGKRIKLSKSILADIKDRNPLKTAAAKLTAMGDNLYDAPVKLRLSQNPVKSTHFREMLALRAGYKLEGRGLKVNVLERPNENGNKCLCEIVGTDVITQLTIEVDPKQHYKLIASTCMNEDPLWTEAENDTPGVPPNLSTLERDKPKNLNQYIRYHELIKNNIDESREAAE